MKKPICKTCFHRWYCKEDNENYCSLIENEHGGNIKADKTECEFYLKKGTEPKWLCCKCKKNTFGESSHSEDGKHYCVDCYFKKENKRYKEEQRIKKLENIKIVADILGGNTKTAKKIINAIK